MFAFGLLTSSLVAAQTPSESVALQPSAIHQIRILMEEKASRTDAERKIDSEILYALARQRGDSWLGSVPQLRTGARLLGMETVPLRLRGDVGPGLLGALRDLGGSVQGDAVGANARLGLGPGRQVASITLPLERIPALAHRPDVRSIRVERGYELLGQTDITEGVVTHRALDVRFDLGVDGTGVQVGVISDGVDSLAGLQALGDLPPGVTVLPGQAGSGSSGTAMLEVVYDMAPGADLLFATGQGGQLQFAQNIFALEGAGCDVIVDDVHYHEEAVFQDDLIAQAVTSFTDSGGLYFSAAGDSGNLNAGTSGVWEGDFVSAGIDPAFASGLDFHDFAFNDVLDQITEDSPSFFVLQWADALGASSNDYDLYFVSPDGNLVWDTSSNTQDGDDDPFEAVTSISYNDTNYNLLVLRNEGSATRFLHLNTNGGELAFSTYGQTSGHAAAQAAFGVAAVDVADAGGGSGEFDGSESVEPFSSDGPRRLFYRSEGTPYVPGGDFSSTGGIVRDQPKLAAADGVDVSTPGHDPFFGTSAAAAHAAAIAALVQEHSNLTPFGFEQLVLATAVDIGVSGFDLESGYGILDALSAVSTTIPKEAASPTAPSCVVDQLTLIGIPNEGPQVFRACDEIHASFGVFDDVRLEAYDEQTMTPGRVVLGPFFSTSGPLEIRTSN